MKNKLRRFKHWFVHDGGPGLLIGLVLVGLGVFLVLWFGTDVLDNEFEKTQIDGRPLNAPLFINGPGDTYGFHIVIDGRTIPCISTGNGVSCDWSAK